MLNSIKNTLPLAPLRQVYAKAIRNPIRRGATKQLRRFERMRYTRPIRRGQAGHDVVGEAVAGGCAAIGKVGSSELIGIVRYLKYRRPDGFCDSWGTRAADHLTRGPGVFPRTDEAFTRFAQEFLDALGEMDVLGVWFNPGESKVANRFAPNAKLVELDCLEPHLWENPWMRLAAGKRVLLVSPFTDTARAQHLRLKDVWSKKPAMAPDYELLTLRTPLPAVLVESPYPSWGDGLDGLRSRMSDMDFDIALIGAGAWSLPLAAHAKRLGRVGVHLGGPTQLMFGIRGTRWERWSHHSQYFTDSWVRPSGNERPDTFTRIEGGCYW